MRIVFMGTPPIAVPSLEALHTQGHEIPSVFTPPDRPVGRRQKLTPPAVKVKAVELGLSVYQVRRVKAPEALEHLRAINPDVIAVFAFGQIIPQTIIELPRFGVVNVHPSLLPKYRGAAPINWAIANGETVTGVTTMRIEQRLDAGDMLLKREVAIAPHETASELSERLAVVGAELLLETLAGLESKSIVPEKQDDDEATHAPLLKREDGWIDWNLTAQQILNRIRGFDPWPGTYTSFRGKRLHVCKARVIQEASAAPGALSPSAGGLDVGCGQGTALAIEEVQQEGKKRISVAEFVRGYRPSSNDVLGETLP